MNSLKQTRKIVAIAVFLISFIVYYFSAERTGSLWDCGEFVLGALKLQIVHPPGAALFLLVGRLFAGTADLFTDNPSDIAFSVNLMSGMFSALAAMFMALITIIFGKIALVGRDTETSSSDNLALGLAGLVAGLATAFSSSIWFSAVEGEVYAMSTFFTAMTFWAASHWYELPDTKDNDRWLIFSLFAGGLSIGVHLLSLIAYPSIGLLYYFKKYKKHNLLGIGLSFFAGIVAMYVVQKLVIVGIPTLWKAFELPMVNSFGLPVHSGLVPTVALISAMFYFVLKYARKKENHTLHVFTIASILTCIAFSTIGVIVVRANADPPINMNVPSDVTRLIPYLNREQYGERPLVRGPHYQAEMSSYSKEDRFGLVDGKYEIVDEKYTLEYAPKDMMLFPRISHNDQNRKTLHNYWRQQLQGDANGKPDMSYNLSFFWEYQIGWMYCRYFMWNFVGKQNGDQGFFTWDKRNGNWQSGIKFFDEAKLYNMDKITDTMKADPSNNKYYFLPLIFGILGLVFHFFGNKRDFFVLMTLFLLTGIGLIIYSNQPPNEPRERDYVLIGSFMTFCVWMGMGVLAIYDMIKDRLGSNKMIGAGLAGALVLSAPLIMGFQNFDDHSRNGHYGSRDYANNFLNSVDENAIIFTYGDNDTYPLWYAQEVEGIRQDVRVVNLSLIQVDWYINKLRNKINDSEGIKLTLSPESIRGRKRNQVFFPDNKSIMPLDKAIAYIADPRNDRQGQVIAPTRNFALTIDQSKIINSPIFEVPEGKNIEGSIPFSFPSARALVKDELAILDIISSNFYDRPIYFAVTCQASKLLNLNDYMQLEGLALRVVPWKTKSEAGMQIYGYGRVDSDKVYDNVMNKWMWGNFDKFDTYINPSYGPEINAMKMGLVRAASDFLRKGQNDKAAELANKLFEAFPHFNFPYDKTSINPINILARAKDFENTKKHLRILAEETRQNLEFYDSLDADDRVSFGAEVRDATELVPLLLNIAGNVEDPAFQQEIGGMLSKYITQQIPN